jgi:hypothetical protein
MALHVTFLFIAPEISFRSTSNRVYRGLRLYFCVFFAICPALTAGRADLPAAEAAVLG